MNTRYTVTRNGIWWDVRRPTGQRVADYGPGEWDAAIAEAYRLSTLDQIRDHKHAQLFGKPALRPGTDLWRLIAGVYRKEPGRKADYVLAN